MSRLLSTFLCWKSIGNLLFRLFSIISVYGLCQSDFGRKVSIEQEKRPDYGPAVDVPGVRNLTFEYEIQCLTGSHIEDTASDLLSTLLNELVRKTPSL